jgi:hypothetical protein
VSDSSPNGSASDTPAGYPDAPTPPPLPPEPGYGPPAQQPYYEQPAQPPYYEQPTSQGYPQPYAYGSSPGYGYAPAQKTNALAITSLVSGIAAFVIFPVIAAIVAVITGHIALRQLKTSGEAGRGLALSGTILGWVGIGLGVLAVVFVVWVAVAFGSVAATSTYDYS